MYIKICGIKSVAIAEAAVQAGAHFIGLIFAPNSPRAVDISTAASIAQHVRQAGAIPVAVFTNASADYMQAVCNKAAIQYVQLHGKIARAQHHLLPETWHRIYVCSVAETGLIIQDEANMQSLQATRDFLLFDALQPGSGQVFSWENFKNPYAFTWFLSAGLNPENVGRGIQQLCPDGVDVSSGVEDATGEKSITLIQKFIRESL